MANLRARTILKLLLLPIIAAAPAAGAVAPANSAPQPTLAAALAGALPPDAGVALAVAADQVYLPPNARPPAPHDSLGNVADVYGRLLRQFGAVTAVAPPTMVTLNTHPRTQDILDAVTPSDALQLLLASLSDAQWQALASLDGIPLSALQDDWQRALVTAFFRNRALTVNLDSYTFSPTSTPARPRVVPPAEIMQGRLRMTRRIQMFFSPLGSNGGDRGSDRPTLPDGSRLYSPDYASDGAQGFVAGEPIGDGALAFQLREETPNRPKPGDLNLSDRRFRALIPLAGLKTAGELVERIARMTRTEIYIDRRSESKPLTLTGAAAAPAADLLSALAFCFTGTYRVVGSAFVLTDDRVGIGTRQQILVEYEEMIKRQREKLLNKARKAGPRLSVEELPLRPDSVALTPAQMQQGEKQKSADDAGEGIRVTLPLNQLTPDQQSAAMQDMNDLGEEVDHNGPIQVRDEPSLQLLVPGLDGAINLGMYAQVQMAFFKWPSPPDHRKAATPADLLELISRYAHRPALVTPRTAADVASIVTSMRQLGLNEMWIVIFGPQVPAKSDSKALDGDDLLSAALKDTKNTGIAVIPVLDVLNWNPASARGSEDLNILGENSLEVEARWEPIRKERTGETPPPPEPGLQVSPFAPAVQYYLANLIHHIAANPDVGGIVWENASPFGYDDSLRRDEEVSNIDVSMGFTTAARLAFLRREHVDPVDLRSAYPVKFDTSLPEFDNSALESELAAKWDAFRADQDEALMKRLLQIARTARPPGTPAPPVLLGVHSIYYFTWDNQVMPLRTQNPLTAPTGSDLFRQIKAHSRDVMSAVGFSWWRQGGLVQDYMIAIIGDSPWNGVVLDCDPVGTLALVFSDDSTAAPKQSSASVLAQLAAASTAGSSAPQKAPTPP